MTNSTDNYSVASGVAALSICESLILAMGDLNIIGKKDAVGVISDAASAHRDAGHTPQAVAMHREVTAILDRIVAGGNSVRRP